MNKLTAIFAVILTMVFLFALVAAIDKNMGVVRYIRRDWFMVMPRRIENSRYRGLSRPAYSFLCFAYYFTKSLFVLVVYSLFRFYKFLLWDVWCALFRFETQSWYLKLYEVFHPDAGPFYDEEDDENERDYDAEWFCRVMADWPDIR